MPGNGCAGDEGIGEGWLGCADPKVSRVEP